MAAAIVNAPDTPVTFKSISFTDSADIVDAVPGKRIVVTSYVLFNNVVGNTIKWQSNASTNLTGTMTNAQTGFFYPGPLPAFATNPGEKLNIVCGGANLVLGHLTYYLSD